MRVDTLKDNNRIPHFETLGSAADRQGFRSDINGLRAIAIVSVALFHFRVAGFSGGFAGVDIFFVISGFLMTGIVVRRCDRRDFSLPGFYADRGRRIVPALLALVLALIVYGWLFLPPIDYLLLAKHAAGAVTFSSNILFWRESGYFDQTAIDNWVLHTWSLSVEWQFYMLFPILMMLLSGRARRSRRPVVLALALASLGLSAWLAHTRPISGFYLLPPRAWEMFAGSLVWLMPLPDHLS